MHKQISMICCHLYPFVWSVLGYVKKNNGSKSTDILYINTARYKMYIYIYIYIYLIAIWVGSYI